MLAGGQGSSGESGVGKRPHPPGASWQTPWLQGSWAQGWLGGRQSGGREPGGQRQRKPFSPSTQEPPSPHGLDAHSLISMLQRGPGEHADNVIPEQGLLSQPGRDNFASFSTATPLSKDHLIFFLTHQLLCKLEQPPPKSREALPQIIFVPKLT